MQRKCNPFRMDRAGTGAGENLPALALSTKKQAPLLKQKDPQIMGVEFMVHGPGTMYVNLFL